MKMLVTGANGYLGARLYTDLAKKFETYGTYHTSSLFPELIKLELANGVEVSSVIKRIAPDVIIHTAAIPTAQRAKENEELAFDINVNGTKRVVDAAIETSSKVILISTGAADTPNEAYGITKKEAEKIVSSGKIEYLILRPSLIIGQSPNTTNDRFQNRLLKNIAGGVPARYENSALFRVTWIGQITEVIEEVIKSNITGETIPVLAEEKRTRFQIANDVLKEFNIECTPFLEQGEPTNFTTTTKKLEELHLKIYSYDEVIKKTVNEIKEYLKNK
jgi:dTDP-4-dehydrorhamnose reductase